MLSQVTRCAVLCDSGPRVDALVLSELTRDVLAIRSEVTRATSLLPGAVIR